MKHTRVDQRDEYYILQKKESTRYIHACNDVPQAY